MTLLLKFVNSKRNIFESTDPDHFYVENIRNFFNVSTGIAKKLCETLVRHDVLESFYEVRCPLHNSVIHQSKLIDDFPSVIHCENCELGENDITDYTIEDLHIHKFYRMK